MDGQDEDESIPKWVSELPEATQEAFSEVPLLAKERPDLLSPESIPINDLQAAAVNWDENVVESSLSEWATFMPFAAGAIAIAFKTIQAVVQLSFAEGGIFAASGLTPLILALAITLILDNVYPQGIRPVALYGVWVFNVTALVAISVGVGGGFVQAFAWLISGKLESAKWPMGTALLAGAILNYAVIVVLILAIGYVQRFFIRRQLSFPRADAVFSLLRAAWWLRRIRVEGDALDIAAESMARAARDVRDGLPRSLSSASAGVREAYKSRCGGIANRIDAFMLAAITAKTDSEQAEIRQSITICAVRLLALHDGAILIADAIPIAQIGWLWRLAGFAKTVLVGATPLIVLTIIRQAGINLSAQVGDIVLPFSVVWAAVCFLTLIDPELGSQIESTRNLLGVIRGRSDDK